MVWLACFAIVSTFN